jgi:teichuronic acid biosynthesis glycosyltransferase TuaG
MNKNYNKQKIYGIQKNTPFKSNFFSIIVPCFNGQKYIDRCIKSILSQTYNGFEVLVIDDGSSDSSYEILKKYSDEDKRIKLIRHKINQGLSSARNTGLNNAVGQFIAFLDIDDWWPKNKLNIYAGYFLMEYDLLYSDFTRFKSTKNKKLIRVKKNINFNKLIFSNLIPISTGAYDQKKLGYRYFEYDSPSEDWLFWLNLIKDSKKSLGINKNLMFYSVSGSSMSANKINMAKKAWMIFREFHKFNIIKSCYCFTIYFYNGIKRSFL